MPRIPAGLTTELPGGDLPGGDLLGGESPGSDGASGKTDNAHLNGQRPGTENINVCKKTNRNQKKTRVLAK